MGGSKLTVLQFIPSSTTASNVTARVDQLVIFNISDCYVRCPDQAERAIGTLLGSVLPDGTVDIRNSYVVPYNEFSDQVALDIEYHHTMLKSHLRVNPQKVIVGWFSTGLGVTGGGTLIHEFYSRDVSNPVHLTVDTGFRNGGGTMKAYVSINLSVGDRQLAAQFQEITLDLRMKPSELDAQSDHKIWVMMAVDILKTTMADKLPNDLEGIKVLMERLVTLINDVNKYADDIYCGRVAPDNNIGRYISDAISSLPKLLPPALDKLINDSLRDQLLSLYLSSITRTQLSLAEKLNTSAQMLSSG